VCGADGLGVALLAAAGLLAHSLWRLSTVDPGFQSERILGFNLSVPTNLTMQERQRFYTNALDAVNSIPGVSGAGMISFLPPETRAGVFMPLSIEGEPADPNAPRVINTLVSSTEYFATMGMPMVRGRDFSSSDTTQSPAVIIVNEALVRRYFGSQDPVGRRIGTGFDGGRPVRECVRSKRIWIIGLLRDMRMFTCSTILACERPPAPAPP